MDQRQQFVALGLSQPLDFHAIGATNAPGPAATWARAMLDRQHILGVGLGAGPLDDGGVRIFLECDDPAKLDRAVQALRG